MIFRTFTVSSVFFSIFLKLSTYLKSRLLSIRLAARETMQHILTELGPSYFPKLLSEMMSILTKGFQIHVLVFTCHAILEKIQSMFTAGHMDACVDPVLEVRPRTRPTNHHQVRTSNETNLSVSDLYRGFVWQVGRRERSGANI